MFTLIDGKAVAQQIRNELKQKAETLLSERAIKPGIGFILVGNNPASQVYVKSKAKACSEVGFFSHTEQLPEDTPENVVIDLVKRFNDDPKLHGILVQLPLPAHIDEHKVIESISPAKDVDGLHPVSFGRLVIGLPGFVPCTPSGIMELLTRYEIPTHGKHVVVVGRSNIVGKPIANLLYQKNPRANAIVTICHTAAGDLRQYTTQADILIAAAGVPQLIKADYIKEGAAIIDVGINRVEDNRTEKGYRIVGDVDFDSVLDKVSAITPVPGGVGPMTIAMLMSNTFKAAAGEF